MRVAFLPLTMMLLGGAAWGQATNAPVQDKSLAPSVVRSSQSGTAQATEFKLQQRLGLMQAQIEQRLRARETERPETSVPQQIPTQWPHAKLEPIPTQWKAQVILVGGAAARPARKPATKGAGALVVPK